MPTLATGDIGSETPIGSISPEDFSSEKSRSDFLAGIEGPKGSELTFQRLRDLYGLAGPEDPLALSQRRQEKVDTLIRDGKIRIGDGEVQLEHRLEDFERIENKYSAIKEKIIPFVQEERQKAIAGLTESGVSNPEEVLEYLELRYLFSEDPYARWNPDDSKRTIGNMNYFYYGQLMNQMRDREGRFVSNLRFIGDNSSLFSVGNLKKYYLTTGMTESLEVENIDKFYRDVAQISDEDFTKKIEQLSEFKFLWPRNDRNAAARRIEKIDSKSLENFIDYVKTPLTDVQIGEMRKLKRFAALTGKSYDLSLEN
nr:hypothetical protein [Patescibacteria group bacterium]